MQTKSCKNGILQQRKLTDVKISLQKIKPIQWSDDLAFLKMFCEGKENEPMAVRV